jgi:hypothetical protein
MLVEIKHENTIKSNNLFKWKNAIKGGINLMNLFKSSTVSVSLKILFLDEYDIFQTINRSASKLKHDIN